MEFLQNNWLDIAMIAVGSLALVVYVLQVRSRKTEAALLIIQQLNEIQNDVASMSACVVDHKLNEGAFYEMLPLIGENYWSKYKHLFIRNMDAQSISLFDKLYKYVGVLQEQYNLIHNLQRNFFFVNQQVIANLEGNFITTGITTMDQSSMLIRELTEKMEQTDNDENKNLILKLAKQIMTNNPNMDLSMFWNYYNANRQKLIGIINQNALTEYIPVQIRISIENAISQYALLNITGCEGYKRLLKISKRKI